MVQLTSGMGRQGLLAKREVWAWREAKVLGRLSEVPLGQVLFGKHADAPAFSWHLGIEVLE